MKHYQMENGDRMPGLGLGTWKSQPGEVYKAVKVAIESGYRHIDCAPIYGNEPEVGQALAESFNAGIVTREEMWITSKLWNDCHDPDDVAPALQQTLADLQLDYLDLYLIHWPVALRRGVSFPRSAGDFLSPAELPLTATWSAMEEMVHRGLTRHIGVSNFSKEKVEGLLHSGKIPPAVNQVELHPYLQQKELLSFCNAHGVHLTAYSPLGSPDRPPSLKAAGEPSLLKDGVIRRIASRLESTPGQVLISWALHRQTSVIPKSVKSERIRENLAARAVKLNEEDMQIIEGLDRHFRYLSGTFWALPGGPYTVENIWDE